VRRPAIDVALPLEAIFLVLFVVYLVYSEWAGLDSRYPIAAGLVLLVVAAVADAAGAVDAANTLAVYVFFLLAGGVLLLLIDHVRLERRKAHVAGIRSVRFRPGADQEPAPPSDEQ
jgi:hypothetical protein